ncbi:MAG: hypothetical protein NTW55_00105 [Planctomycetota bacterium]|nr:hypothetical protein [Planctomycetota bacterium]
MKDLNITFLIDHIKSPGPWLSWKGCSKSVAIGLVTAIALIYLQIYPQSHAKEGEYIYPFWQFGYLVVLPTICFLVWLLSTQIYLRTGTGYKIGIAYEGDKIKQDDWRKTQDILRDLFRDNKIQKKVKLRFVPSVFSHENNKAVTFAKRYKFQILASIQETMQANPTSHKEIRIRIESKPQYDAFMKNVFHQVIMFPKITQSKNLLEILDTHAQSLRDIILLLVGTTLFHSEKYEDAAIILRYLDNALEATLSPSQPPRLQVRNLDMHSRLTKARFPAAKIPPYEELNEIKQVAETTICYFDQFPDVALSVARVRFLVGDVNGAVELTKMAVDKVHNIEKSGQQVPSAFRANIFLNHAFLSYIQGHWSNFYESLKIILNDKTYTTLKWDDLVNWSDYVDSLEQFEGIVFLKVIYRLIAGQIPDKNMLEEANRWANSDGSRDQLSKTLNRCMSLHKNNSKKTNRKVNNSKHGKKK